MLTSSTTGSYSFIVFPGFTHHSHGIETKLPYLVAWVTFLAGLMFIHERLVVGSLPTGKVGSSLANHIAVNDPKF